MSSRTRGEVGEPIMISVSEMKRLQRRLKTVEDKLKELQQVLNKLKRKKEAKKK